MSSGCPIDVSITIGVCAEPPIALDPLRQHESVDLGHLAVRDHHVEAITTRLRRVAEHRPPLQPSPTVVGFMRQLASISSRMRRFVALSSTTSTRRPSSAPGRSRDGRSVGTAGVSKHGCEVERAAAADLALHPHAAAHQFDQTQGNRQSEASAAVAPCRGAVGLGKRVKNLPLFVRRDADARIAHREVQRRMRRVRTLSTSTRSTTSPSAVNLTALPITFSRTCRSRPGSPSSTSGTSAAM